MKKWQFTNGRVFSGENWLDNPELETENGRFITADGKSPATIFDLGGGILAPAFIDIQLYGGNGQLFGENPSVESLQATVDYSKAGGAALILPTVATHSNDIVFKAIDAVRHYWEKGGNGVFGLHLEGPFLNPAKKGAHAEKYIQVPTPENLHRLLDYGKGVVKLMTIAPEMFSPDQLNELLHAGILLSIGHSNATYEQATEALHTIPLATHLFNAMSPLQHRAPGLPGAIFNHPTAMASIVADGNHVDAAVIRIAKKQMGDRLFLITDAVTENNNGHYRHIRQGNRFVMPDGTLSGSALTMRTAVAFCVEQVGIDTGEALRMAGLYPARALGIDRQRGLLHPGFDSVCAWLLPDGSSSIIVL